MNQDAKNELPDDLARGLSALDARAARAAARVDGARVAGAVLKRLREGDVEPLRRPVWQLTLVRVAAAVVLVAASAVTVRRIAWHSGAAVALPVAVQADGFTTGDLGDMLKAVDEARVAGSRTAAPQATVTVDDLNVQELVALLSALDAPVEKT